MDSQPNAHHTKHDPAYRKVTILNFASVIVNEIISYARKCFLPAIRTTLLYRSGNVMSDPGQSIGGDPVYGISY
jgi:hypothetical protein